MRPNWLLLSVLAVIISIQAGTFLILHHFLHIRGFWANAGIGVGSILTSGVVVALTIIGTYIVTDEIIPEMEANRIRAELASKHN